MDTTISATHRPAGNKGAARKTRQAGRIPAVVYGPDADPTPIAVDPKMLINVFRKTRDRNTIVELDIEGEKLPTLVREVQRHPVSRDILHVDFYRVSKKRKVEVMVPVETVGRPAGAVLGGRLRLIRRSIRTRCDYDKIPKSFVIDVSPMEIGDIVQASEIATPDGVDMVFDNDFNVAMLYGKSKAAKKAEAAEAAAEAAEGEEGAAGEEAAEAEE